MVKCPNHYIGRNVKLVEDLNVYIKMVEYSDSVYLFIYF